MYYLANLFNQNNLFQHLGGWLATFLEKTDKANEKSEQQALENLRKSLERFLFHAY